MDALEPPVALALRDGAAAGQVLPSWQTLLFDSDGLRISQWLETGEARLVKHGPRRAVYRVDVPQASFFVKHYRRGPWWQGLSYWFRASPSHREFVRARETLRRQIATAEPLAWIERRRGAIVDDSFLVTRAVGNSCTLDHYLQYVLPRSQSAEQARLRRKLTVSLAQLCATSHREGIEHDDLHLGNVLVRLDTCSQARGEEGLPELSLIDLPGVRLSRPLSDRRTIASLTMLAGACAEFATQTDLWRFWLAYVAARPELTDAGAVWRQIAERVPVDRRRVARRRDRRAMKTNRDFYTLRQAGSRGYAVTDVARDTLAQLIENPSAPLVDNLHDVYKLSHRSVVVQAPLPLNQSALHVAYKRVRPRNWWKTLLHYFRRSPALDAWHYGHALLLRGIATARPLLVIERSRFGLPAEGFLATEWIEGAKNLHVYCWELAGRSADERRRRTRQVARSLGRLLGRMHAWHVSHRDLKGCNILLVERDNAVDCYLIDADSVRLPRRLSPFFRAFNLARLATSVEAHGWITRADRARFWRAYLAELHRRDRAAWPADWKTGWRAVAKAVRRIIGRLKRANRDVV